MLAGRWLFELCIAVELGSQMLSTLAEYSNSKFATDRAPQGPARLRYKLLVPGW